MDQSYLKFAQSLSYLGSALEQICRRSERSGLQFERAVIRVHQLVEFADALNRAAPQGDLPISARSELDAATLRLRKAQAELLAPPRLSPTQLYAAASLSNSILSGVLPGLPNLPDLPKPISIPPDDIASLAADDKDD